MDEKEKDKLILDEQNLSTEEMFADDIAQIDKDIAEMEQFYIDTKSHYDGIKNAQFKGSLQFIEKQTANLISIKNATIGMRKEKINIKKIIRDYQFKEKQLSQKSVGEEGGLNAITMELFNMIQNSNTIKPYDVSAPSERQKYTEEDILAMEEELDELLSDDDEEYIEQVIQGEEKLAEDAGLIVDDEDNSRITSDSEITLTVVDYITKKFYEVTEDYELIGEVDIDDEVTELIEDGEEYIAMTRNGMSYEVVTINE